MTDENDETRKPTIQADNKSVAVGSIAIGGSTGDINIHAGDIGYSVEEVSVLLTQITSTFQPKPFDGRCPYKGLEVFEEEDAELFFGREKLVEDLLNRVKESRTVFITGPSGSGKSSLVRAGLIHALKQDAIKNLHSEHWLYETMKPGREPLKELALAFSRLKSPELANYFRGHASEINILNECAESVLSGRKDQRFVLFIDQFEEVFTQINWEEERIAFINMLAHAATIENGRVIVLFAMRSDFVSNCVTYPMLNELLSHQFRQIGAMQPDELVSAIALPAKHVGLPIEEELIARIINDMKGEPGALPLMQFALKDLFDAQQEKGGVIALTLEDYLKHGGIHKSLERHADKSFATLSENEQELARSIFSGLIEIGRGTQDTRRIALFDELVPANVNAAEVESVVQRLADARLIITDEQAGKDTVTISHEKLIDAWPWLKKMVNENRDVIALQNEIAADAKEWADHQRDPSYLYTGARLANAREQLEAKKLVLSGNAHEFVIAGQAQQRRNRTTRMIGVTVPLGLVIVGILIFSYILTTNSANLAEERLFAVNTQAALVSTSRSIAVTAQSAAAEARKQTTIARAGELAAQAVVQRDTYFDLSLLLSVQAFLNTDTTRTRSILLDNVETNPQLVQYLRGHNDTVTSVAFSPDGNTLASGSDDYTIILWDTEGRQPIGQPLTGHSYLVSSVAFSPDGKTLASGSWDGTIILWDVAGQQPIGQPLTGHSGGVFSVAFSPDGSTLASGSESLTSGSDDGTIILWDLASQQPIGQPLTGHSGGASSVTFSPDGNTLASGSGDGTIILWDVASRQPIGQPLTGHSGGVTSVAFSSDGNTLASGSGDYTITLWDVANRQPIGQPLTGHSNFVRSVAFSPDGNTLASASGDGTIILWDVASRQPIGQPLTGHSVGVTGIAFSPHGKTLASGSDDHTIILWAVESQRPIGQPLTGHSDSVHSVAFSPDGNTLASGNNNQTIILWDVESQQPIGQPLTGHSDSVHSVAFSPDGNTLASASTDHTIILWDVESQQPIGQPLTGHTGPVSSVSFSLDGNTLASGSWDSTIILWDVASQQPIGQPLTGHSGGVTSVAFSPDGKTLASGSDDGTIILWDVASQQPIGQPLTGHSNFVSSVVFSPDGKTLASGSGTITLWDVASRQPIGQPLTGHSGGVTSVAFSPDGKILASGSRDGTITLWDVASQQPIGQPLTGHSGSVTSVAFSPDGKTLASGSDDGMSILWDIDPQSWIKKTCQRTGRNLTRAEWALYIPYEPYPTKQEDATCPQWPLEPQVTGTATP